MLCLAVVLAIQASIFQVSQAADVPDAAMTGGPPSCDIKDLGCIAKDLKAALSVNHTTFKSEYQQFAEMIAPVLLLAHGGNFEVCKQGFPSLLPENRGLSGAVEACKEVTIVCVLGFVQHIKAHNAPL